MRGYIRVQSWNLDIVLVVSRPYDKVAIHFDASFKVGLQKWTRSGFLHSELSRECFRSRATLADVLHSIFHLSGLEMNVRDSGGGGGAGAVGLREVRSEKNVMTWNMAGPLSLFEFENSTFSSHPRAPSLPLSLSLSLVFSLQLKSFSLCSFLSRSFSL